MVAVTLGRWSSLATLPVPSPLAIHIGASSRPLCGPRESWIPVPGPVAITRQGYSLRSGSNAEAVISTGGQKVASAEIRYVVGPFPNDTIRGAMLVKAREIGFPEACLHADQPS